MRLAVLVPVYNAGAFLTACLDSLFAQEGVDLEVFCRNDGSTDDSLDILKGYAAREPRLHCDTQPNMGVVKTRNRLLDDLPNAFDACAFVDSDDFIAPGMYAKMADALERTGAEVAECEWDGPERTLNDLSVFWLKRTAPGQWINVINKLYRPEAIGNIRFREGLSFEEDFFFNCEIHAAIRRKVLVPGRFYTYRDNPGSATHALDFRRYFESTSRRIRLSLDVFWQTERIPRALRARWMEELARDAYRMCIRKNLKKNRDPVSRRSVFTAAGGFFCELEAQTAFRPAGLNPLQRLVYRACRTGNYAAANALVRLA